MEENQPPLVAIIGAGPAGAMAAVLLAQRGFSVDVYEKREDFRAAAPASPAPAPGGAAGAGAAAEAAVFGQSRDAIKRSINLALSARGQAALAAAGLLAPVMAAAVPMPARAIHPRGGAPVVTQAYGDPGQAIFSVSREAVNRALLDGADALPAGPGGRRRVRVHFGADVARVDGAAGVLTVRLADGSTREYAPALILGADGAYSRVREALLRVERADFARRFIAHGYKELTLPAARGGGFALPHAHALHIWPRDAFMLIALPNPDASFTLTLFAPFDVLDALDAGAPAAVAAFFAEHFPDAAAAVGASLPAQFRANPTSALVETRLRPYEHAGRLAVIGDAAHATVPFYGQGMNAALEDALVLAEAVDAEAAKEAVAAGGIAAGAGGVAAGAGAAGAAAGSPPAPPAPSARALAAAVRAYGAARQPAGLALCDLSMGNYDEMKAKTGSLLFRARVRLEQALHRVLGDAWQTQYAMVAFTRIPYDEVVRRAAAQDAAMDAALLLAGAAAAAAAVAAALALARVRVSVRVDVARAT